METESLKSERSSKSHRSRGNPGLNSHHRTRRSNHSNKSSKRSDMAPYQTSVNLNGENNSNVGQEIIEVQILPQDDENWGRETAVTGNTSDQSISMEDVSNWPSGNEMGLGFACQRYVERLLSLILCLTAFFSPIAMAVSILNFFKKYCSFSIIIIMGF